MGPYRWSLPILKLGKSSLGLLKPQTNEELYVDLAEPYQILQIMKYSRSSCEVEQIGTLVRLMSAAHAAARIKRCAKSTLSGDGRVLKR